MENNLGEFTIEVKNNTRRMFGRVFLVLSIFAVLLAFLLGIFAKQTMYTKDDVQEVSGILTEVAEKNNMFDLTIDQHTYRLSSDLSEQINKEALYDCVDKEIVIFYLRDIAQDFVVGIESPNLTLDIEDGLASFYALPAVIFFSVFLFLILLCCIYVIIRYFKAPKNIEVNQTQFYLFHQRIMPAYQKKINKFLIWFLLVFVVFVGVTLYLGAVDENSVTFYVFLALTCLSVVGLGCACPIILKKVRKETTKDTLAEFSDTRVESFEDSIEIFNGFGEMTCRFEKERLVLSYEDYEFDEWSESDGEVKLKEFSFDYSELDFTTTALFRSNGIVNIAIETPLYINELQQRVPLIIDINKKRLDLLRRFNVKAAGLELLISNLDKFLNKYNGNVYIVTFDSNEEMTTRKLKIKDQLQLQG